MAPLLQANPDRSGVAALRDLEVVWPQLISLAVIGSALFAFSLARFRKALAAMVWLVFP